MASSNVLRDMLVLPNDGRVEQLMGDLKEIGYSSRIFYDPYPMLRVGGSRSDIELDIAIRAGYLDVLGKRVSYADAVNRIKRIFSKYDAV